jgi:2-dehydropantoate 2-reductase
LEEIMKTLIIGAGIVGTIFGQALSEAKQDITHLVRAGRAAELADGIPMDMLDRRKRRKNRFKGIYPIRAVESIEDPDQYGLVIFPGHHFTIGEILQDIVPRFKKVDFLFMTQNWKGTEDIDAVLPRSRYVYGDAKAGGSWRDGVLVGAIKSVDIGPVGAEGEALARSLAEFLKTADIESRYQGNMREYLWVQFALNAGLWPALVEAGSFKALLARKNRSNLEKAFAALRECLALLERRGLKLANYPELGLYRSHSRIALDLTLLMMRTMFALSEWTRRVSAHALSDAREIRAFYFDLLHLAEDLGQAMPVFSSYAPVIEKFNPEGVHSGA